MLIVLKALVFILCLSYYYSCKKISTPDTSVTTKEQRPIHKVFKGYSEYTSLSVSFKIKTNINFTIPYCLGYLESKYKEDAYSVNIQLRDPIFQSILFDITEKEDTYTIRSLNHSKLVGSIEDSIDLMGVSVPAYFIFAILKNKPYSLIPDANFDVSQSMQSFKVNLPSHEIDFFFNDLYFTKYILKQKSNLSIIHITIIDYFINNNFFYPKQILITKENSKDSIELNFNQPRILP